MIKVWYTPVLCDHPITSDGGDLRVFRADGIIERMLELYRSDPDGMLAMELIEAMESDLDKAVQGEAQSHNVQRETLSGL